MILAEYFDKKGKFHTVELMKSITSFDSKNLKFYTFELFEDGVEYVHLYNDRTLEEKTIYNPFA